MIINPLKLTRGNSHQPTVLVNEFYLAGDWVYFGYFPCFVVVGGSHALLRKVALLFAVKAVFVKKTA